MKVYPLKVFCGMHQSATMVEDATRANIHDIEHRMRAGGCSDCWEFWTLSTPDAFMMTLEEAVQLRILIVPDFLDSE